MSRRNWYLLLGAVMVALSAILYAVHFAVFHDSRHVFIYLLGGLAFLPLEVLFVTLIIDRLLNDRDKRAALDKMNMVIGAFFSEAGTELLRSLCAVDSHGEDMGRVLRIDGGSSEADFESIKSFLADLDFSVDARDADLVRMREYLVARRDFMVGLLENPLLLEHESFTDLLWAVFHLTEELERRDDLESLPEADLGHISTDMGRVYGHLVRQWVYYMEHLKESYPYLFSLAVRVNPFNPTASPVVA